MSVEADNSVLTLKSIVNDVCEVILKVILRPNRPQLDGGEWALVMSDEGMTFNTEGLMKAVAKQLNKNGFDARIFEQGPQSTGLKMRVDKNGLPVNRKTTESDVTKPQSGDVTVAAV